MDWGKPYGGDGPSYNTPDGPVWMRRKGQRVRFFDAGGDQVGPEQSNVAPAAAYAMSQGWTSPSLERAGITPPVSGVAAPDRPLHSIADEIRRDWRPPNFAAVPYLDAMQQLDSIDDPYYEDSGDSIVAYFLSNAGSWRGDTARRVKAELRDMLKRKRLTPWTRWCPVVAAPEPGPNRAGLAVLRARHELARLEDEEETDSRIREEESSLAGLARMLSLPPPARLTDPTPEQQANLERAVRRLSGDTDDDGDPLISANVAPETLKVNADEKIRPGDRIEFMDSHLDAPRFGTVWSEAPLAGPGHKGSWWVIPDEQFADEPVAVVVAGAGKGRNSAAPGGLNAGHLFYDEQGPTGALTRAGQSGGTYPERNDGRTLSARQVEIINRIRQDLPLRDASTSELFDMIDQGLIVPISGGGFSGRDAKYRVRDEPFTEAQALGMVEEALTNGSLTSSAGVGRNPRLSLANELRGAPSTPRLDEVRRILRDEPQRSPFGSGTTLLHEGVSRADLVPALRAALSNDELVSASVAAPSRPRGFYWWTLLPVLIWAVRTPSGCGQRCRPARSPHRKPPAWPSRTRSPSTRVHDAHRSSRSRGKCSPGSIHCGGTWCPMVRAVGRCHRSGVRCMTRSSRTHWTVSQSPRLAVLHARRRSSVR